MQLADYGLRLRSRTVSADPKWIEHDGAKTGDVTIIACHERQAIDQSGRRKQAVDDRNRPDGREASPLVGDRIVDTEHTTVEHRFNLPQPSFERYGFVRIAWARKLDPLAYFPKNEGTQKDISV
jgi:hypothetical protein